MGFACPACPERWRGKRSLYGALPRPFRVAITFLLMLLSWVLFRAEGLGDAGRYFAAMFGLGEADGAAMLLAAEIYTPMSLVLTALCAALVIQPVQAFDWARRPLTPGRAVTLLLLFALALIVMSAQAFNPFLYFQF